MLLKYCLFANFQRIVTFIVICGFIPINWFVFMTQPISIPPSLQNAYSLLFRQVNSGFVLDSQNNCTQNLAIQAPSYCFEKCKLEETCSIVPNNRNCTRGQFQYSLNGVKYCAGKQIHNQISKGSVSSDPININKNTSNLPMFQLNSLENISYYLYNGNRMARNEYGLTCKQTLDELFGESLNFYAQKFSYAYTQCLRNLYYTLLPIFVFTFVSAILQTFSKYDFKKTVQIFLFNTIVISISIMVIGIVYDNSSKEFQDTIKWLGDNCIVSNTEAFIMKEQFVSAPRILANGLSTGFTIFMGVICAVQILLIVALVIIWLMEIRMMKLRKEGTSISNYQLQSL